MPIITRTLEHVRNHGAGVWVQENLVDHLGRSWYHNYTIGTEAEAQVLMDARDMTAQLEDTEERDAVAFIKAGGDPSTFPKVDLTNVEFNRRIAKRFAKARFDLDPDFVRNVADWVTGFTAVQIATALGITEAKGTIILNRAIAIVNTLTAGSADDSAYVGALAVVEDQATSTQKAVGVVSAYTGSTKTVTLAADPGIFTMATGDTIDIVAVTPALPAAPADAAGGLPISDAGGLDLDAMDTSVAAIEVDTSTTLDGKIDTIDTNVDTILVDTGTTLDDHLTDIKGTSFVKDTHSLIDLKTETALIVADTNELQSDDIPGTIAALNDISTAQVNTEVDNSMVTYGLDHLVSASVTGTDITDNSIVAKLVSKEATADWDDFVNTTDSLQAVRDHIGDGTNLTEAGGDGDHLTAINLPNQTMDITGTIDTVTTVTNDVGITATAVDNVWDEAMVQTTGAPAVTGTFRAAIQWIFALSRNKITQTATTSTLRNDADAADLSTSTVSDDGTTATRGEWST